MKEKVANIYLGKRDTGTFEPWIQLCVAISINDKNIFIGKCGDIESRTKYFIESLTREECLNFSIVNGERVRMTDREVVTCDKLPDNEVLIVVNGLKQKGFKQIV